MGIREKIRQCRRSVFRRDNACRAAALREEVEDARAAPGADVVPPVDEVGLIGLARADRWLAASGISSYFFVELASGQSGSLIRMRAARATHQDSRPNDITSYAYWNAALAPRRSPPPSRFQPIT